MSDTTSFEENYLHNIFKDSGINVHHKTFDVLKPKPGTKLFDLTLHDNLLCVLGDLTKQRFSSRKSVYIKQNETVREWIIAAFSSNEPRRLLVLRMYMYGKGTRFSSSTYKKLRNIDEVLNPKASARMFLTFLNNLRS